MASHLARFQTDDSLLGECDPWAAWEFHTPHGPERRAYRAEWPLPKNFPRVSSRALLLDKFVDENFTCSLAFV